MYLNCMMKVYTLLLLQILFLSIFSVHAFPRSKRALGHIYVKLWTNATIPYFISPSFSDADVFYIKRAMDLYSNETCIRFEPYKPDLHPNWLKVEDSEMCHSEIGLQNSGQQSLYLATSCRSFGLILHEVSHTIGLMHEMMRPDRNQFIRIFTENMQDGASESFNVESQHYKLFGTPFDFQSITMYSPYDFSKNGLPVWTKMNASETSPIFDSREKDVSFWDIKAINDMYQCGKNCSIKNCKFPNFVDKNCKCQSPEAFAEKRCVDDPNHLDICANASKTDVCFNKPVVSSVICRKTCGRCFRYGSHGVSSPPKYNCVDHNVEQCKQNKEDGYCFTNTWTKVNCKKSCNKCEEHADPSVIEFICKDRHNPYLCEEWASDGQCESNPGFMKSNCALSCKTCMSDVGITKPKAPCRNYSPDKYCDLMAKENKCENTTLTLCLGSCGKCGTNYERNEASITEAEIERVHKITIKKECKDLLTECEYFSSAGHCQTHKESMKYHCNKSCNLCEDAECSNIDSDHVCDDVKQRGLCKLHAGFASRCMKTCEQCKSIPNMETTTASCIDKESKYICQELIRRNQCRVDVNRTRRCLKSCKLCNTFYAYVTDAKNEITTSTQTIPHCVDEDNSDACERLSSNGWCQSYLDRAVLCRKSCNLCEISTTTSICKDDEDSFSCKSWASAGYCRENKKYMQSKCALSCKFCANTQKSVSSCSNIVSDDTCDIWANEKYCEINKEYMNENCKKSCSLCKTTTKMTITPRMEVCKDLETSETCATWKSRGFCTYFSAYLHKHCALTCGVCISHTTGVMKRSTTTLQPCINTQSNDSCESWKNANYCNIAHIAAMCRKTCLKCQ